MFDMELWIQEFRIWITLMVWCICIVMIGDFRTVHFKIVETRYTDV
jgi:hypothetical protein